MSMDRNIKIRVATNYCYFSDVIERLIDCLYSVNEDGRVTSLSEDDIDDFDYIFFESFTEAKNTLNKREEKGLRNYIVLWDRDLDDSLLISSQKLDTSYSGYSSHYELIFSIGYGIRIKGAGRYTDFSAYLNRLVPMLSNEIGYVC